MKVTGETFSFYFKKKRSWRGKIPKVSKFSGKRTVTGQNSGELYKKALMRQFLIFRINLTEFTLKSYFLIT